MSLLVILCAPLAAAEPNALSAEERAEGFQLLFDGRTLNGWSAPRNNWEVDDGALHLRHKGGAIAWTGAKLASDFDLRFEWMLAPKGNSGVHYRMGAFEYQVLDNASYKIKPAGSAGALYNIAGLATNHANPAMQWNQSRILCEGPRIRHWLNGQLVADVDLNAPEWAGILAAERERRSKVLAPGPEREGYLALSDHTGTVWFRSLRLRMQSLSDRPQR